jgi:hypothetical protein
VLCSINVLFSHNLVIGKLSQANHSFYYLWGKSTSLLFLNMGQILISLLFIYTFIPMAYKIYLLFYSLICIQILRCAFRLWYSIFLFAFTFTHLLLFIHSHYLCWLCDYFINFIIFSMGVFHKMNSKSLLISYCCFLSYFFNFALRMTHFAINLT